MKKRIDHTGKVYNSWTVIEYIEKDKRSGDAIWKCRCKCGFEKNLKINNLTNGASKQCVNCAQRITLYPGIIPEPMWNLIIRRANKRCGGLNITKQEAIDIFVQQEGKCALSGLPIRFAESGKDYLANNQTASLDRIDSKKLYDKENVQWVHKTINLMKNILDQNIFINMCRSVSDHHKIEIV